MLGPLVTGGRHWARTRLLHAAVIALVLGGVLYQALPSVPLGKWALASSLSGDRTSTYGER